MLKNLMILIFYGDVKNKVEGFIGHWHYRNPLGKFLRSAPSAGASGPSRRKFGISGGGWSGPPSNQPPLKWAISGRLNW